MTKKQFSTLISTMIIVTVPVHGAQQTFMQKWIVEPSSVILKSKKTWAFAVGAALCCGAYKGYKRFIKDTDVVDQAKELLREEYCIIPRKIGDVELKKKEHIQPAKLCIVQYITQTLVPFGLNPKTDKVCTCHSPKLSLSNRLLEIVKIRAEVLRQIYRKLGQCTPMVRLWQRVKGTDIGTLRLGLSTQFHRTIALATLLRETGVQKAIDTRCDYRGTTQESEGCVSFYCIKKYQKTYSKQS